MTRRQPLRTEVILRLDEAFAEILLPDAVHRHAREQRIVRARQPIGEVEAVQLPIHSRRREEALNSSFI